MMIQRYNNLGFKSDSGSVVLYDDYLAEIAKRDAEIAELKLDLKYLTDEVEGDLNGHLYLSKM